MEENIKRFSLKRLSKLQLSQQAISLAALLLMSIVLAFASPYFITVENISNIGRQAAINMIIATGMTVVILTSGIDLSVGSVLAFVVCLLGAFIIDLKMNMVLGILLSIIAGTGCGLLSGVIIHFGNVPPFVATLGMMGVARGAALIITQGSPTIGFPKGFNIIGNANLFDLVPLPLIIAIVVIVIFYFMLKYTILGRHFFAIGGNQEAARLSNVSIGKTKVLAYVICGLCTSIAAVVYASRVNCSPPAAGRGYELNAIAAVVIGGTNLFGGEGNVLGTIIGALIMAVIGNGLGLLDVSPFWQEFVIGWVIIIAVLMSTVRKRKN